MTRPQLTGVALAVAFTLATPLVAGAQVAAMPQPPDRVEFYSGAPVYTPGDESGPGAAQRNNAESRRYEAALRSNPGFREHRMMRECGSITEPTMYQGCIDSFGDRTAAGYPGYR